MPSRPDGASAGDCPPPPPARAGERQCPPARTVQAAGDSDRVRPPPRRQPAALIGPGRERRCPPARTVQATGDTDCGPTSSHPPPSPPRAWGRQCHPARTVPRNAGDSGSRARAAGGGPPPSPARAGERLCPPARTVQVAGDSDCGPTSSDPPPSLVRARDRQCHPARTVPRNAGGPTPGDSDRAGGAAAQPPAHARRQRARPSARPRDSSINAATRHSWREAGEV